MRFLETGNCSSSVVFCTNFINFIKRSFTFDRLAWQLQFSLLHMLFNECPNFEINGKIKFFFYFEKKRTGHVSVQQSIAVDLWMEGQGGDVQHIFVPPTEDTALKNRIHLVLSTDIHPVEMMDDPMKCRVEADEQARELTGDLCISRMVGLLIGLRVDGDEMPYLYEHDSWDDGMVQLCSMNETEDEMEVFLQRDWLHERDGGGDVLYCVSVFSSVSNTVTIFHSLDSWDSFVAVEDHARSTLHEVAGKIYVA